MSLPPTRERQTHMVRFYLIVLHIKQPTGRIIISRILKN